MKRNPARTAMIMLTALAIIGLGADAFAGWGRGKGPGGGCGDCPRRGAQAQLSEAQLQKLDAERKAFFEDTADLRQELREKRAELRAVMVKKAPDAQQAAQIQTRISALQGELGQKRLAHVLRMKEIAPEAAAGLGRGRGGPHGKRHGWGGPRGRHHGWGPDEGGCRGWGRGAGYRAESSPPPAE